MTKEFEMPAHEDREEALAAYALGALDERDRAELEAHLSTCAGCRAALADLRRVATGIGLAIDPVTPPADLRARVLARATAASALTSEMVDDSGAPDVEDFVIDTSERVIAISNRTTTFRFAPVWALAAAASLIVAIAAGLYAWRIAGDLRSEQLQRAQLEARLSVITSSDVIRVALAGQPDAPAASGRAYMSPARGLVFTAQHLPALPQGRAYQLWIVTAKAPMSVGMLAMAPDGSVTATMPMPGGVHGAVVAVAVTIEPEGGVPAPTGAKVLVGMVAPQ